MTSPKALTRPQQGARSPGQAAATSASMVWWPIRQIASMQPKPQSFAMQIMAHGEFGRGVPAANAAHVPAAGFGAQLIHSCRRTPFFWRLL
jgi:hypothetical protein